MSNLELGKVYWVKRDSPPPSYMEPFKDWTLVRVSMSNSVWVLLTLVCGVSITIEVRKTKLNLFKIVPVLPPSDTEPEQSNTNTPDEPNQLSSLEKNFEKAWECHWVTTERVTYKENYKTHNPKIDLRFCASHFLSYQFSKHKWTRETGEYMVQVKDLATQRTYLVKLTLVMELANGEMRGRRDIEYTEITPRPV